MYPALISSFSFFFSFFFRNGNLFFHIICCGQLLRVLMGSRTPLPYLESLYRKLGYCSLIKLVRNLLLVPKLHLLLPPRLSETFESFQSCWLNLQSVKNTPLYCTFFWGSRMIEPRASRKYSDGLL